MKREYVKPSMYAEEFIAEQYVAANNCSIHRTPNHGHFLNSKGDQIHCAFTSSNCGANATSCFDTINNTDECKSFSLSKHQVITSGNGTVVQAPDSSKHNCHVLSTNAEAQAFASSYKDECCREGVKTLLKLQDFEDIYSTFS